MTLYIDIETIPDYDRLDSFGLEPIKETPETTDADMPDAAAFLANGIDVMKSFLSSRNPSIDWLRSVEMAEVQTKQRKGVYKVLDDARKKKLAAGKEKIARKKMLSVTPEYNKIVAIGSAGDYGPVAIEVVGCGRFLFPFNEVEEKTVVGSDFLESDLLAELWEAVKLNDPIAGYNIKQFDLPTILMRSMLLGVESTCIFDLKPWSTSVIDLMTARYGKGKAFCLKSLAKCLGIEPPAGDVDGSQVEELYREAPDKLAFYCASDVWVTREIHKKMAGYFC